jgi:hypothetical protein
MLQSRCNVRGCNGIPRWTAETNLPYPQVVSADLTHATIFLPLRLWKNRVVLDWNTPSIDYYQAAGATLCPEWKLMRFDKAGLTCFSAKVKAANTEKLSRK